MRLSPAALERQIRRAEKEHREALQAVEREAHRAVQAALLLERLRNQGTK